jgi:hypothetical protein
MAIVKMKKLIEDMERNESTVLGTVKKAMAGALSGTAAVATTAVFATSAGKAASAAYAGTARVAHYGSSGTGALAGT